MRHSQRTLLVLSLTLACAAFAMRATGQTTPQPSGSTLKVSSRLTLVDITVTDSKGQPVHGITQADFTVKEDGRPQPLRSFQEFGHGSAPADKPAAAPAALKLPPNFYTNFQPAPPAVSAVNILLIDDLTTSPAERSLAIKQSADYLKTMPRGTRVAIFELGSTLRTVQWFTSDPEILIAALDTAPPKMVAENAAPSEGMVTVPRGSISPLPPSTQLGPGSGAGELCSNQDIRNITVLTALDQIAAGVSGIKGRKNLLWFTDGIPSITFPDGSPASASDCPRPDYNKELSKTYTFLAAAQVAVYPIDPRGLVIDPGTQAGAHGLGSVHLVTGGGVVSTAGVQTTQANNTFMAKMQNSQDSLDAVARATGGEARYNENDLTSALSEAIQKGSDYYTVSYIPPGLEYDGKYHSIEVKVDRPGVHLEYRKGYTADDFNLNPKAKPDTTPPALLLTPGAAPPYGNEMQAAMAHGADTSRQLPFDVRVQPAPALAVASAKPTAMPVSGSPASPHKGKPVPLVRYEFLYLLPADEIAFANDPDGAHKGTLEFDIAAYDAAGDLVSGQTQTAKLTLKGDETQKFGAAPFQYTQQLDLPSGALFVRIGIFDSVSHKLGTLEIPLTVVKQTVAKK